MKQFFKFMFASMVGSIITAILAIILFFAMLAGSIASLETEKVTTVKENSVLYLDLSKEILDKAPAGPFSGFDPISMKPEKKLGLNKILKNIEKASRDENIKGIYIEASSLATGMATIEEIRNALIKFKESGKFILSYGSNYTQGTYYLATAGDDIILNTEGGVDFKGFVANLMFFKNALEKLEVQPQIIRCGKYKSAIEPFILEKMSDANREQTSKYVFSLWDHVCKGISDARKIPVSELNMLADSMTIRNAKAALKYKLVDKLMYTDEVLVYLREKIGITENDKINKVDIAAYDKAVVKEEDKESTKNRIAVVYAQGQIIDGEGDDENIGGDGLSKILREIRLDTNIKAVVLRVNSPGGSALASEIIWREVALIKEKKPVVVSMGDVAASGGYYIACAASKIYALPNTITGSIGVFGMIPNAQGLFTNKLGITFDQVKTNAHADIMSLYRPLEQSETDIIQNSVNDIYSLFKQRVADGRKMTVEMVDSLGQGRVWSGADALEIGLIDGFGGLNDAIAEAVKLAGIENYRVKEYPIEKEPFEEIMKMLSGGDMDGDDFIARIAGNEFKFFKTLNYLRKAKGVQAMMPYYIEVE
ncbi:MAG: signal peptide peptidase SppA [Bacteroidetes bacterium]|nr:signal peptide peptidase SppA [Bacteroidota bacterium]MBU1720871.1 signal peptide peptidase SppA [Bacteroidota bacterium]